MKKIYALGFLLLPLVSLAMGSHGIHPLSGVGPNLPNGELKSLISPLVGDADFVAIGESVHGSAGMLAMEHRLTRFLVEEHGFRTILLEVPVSRSQGLTNWVKNCTPGERLPIELLYSPIDEDREFFEWMCEWNQAHPQDPVSFHGIDVWDRPWEHQQTLEHQLPQLGLPSASTLPLLRAHCWMHAERDWTNFAAKIEILKREKNIPAADYQPCMSSLELIRTETLHALARADSAQRLALYRTLRAAETAIGWQSNLNFRYESFTKSWNARDLAQGRNEKSLWEENGRKKTVIIAHTTHTSKMESDANWWNLGSFRSGVSYLRDLVGAERVKTIGLIGYEVTGTQGVFHKPTAEDSLDLALHEAGYETAFVDPRGSFVSARDRWWIQNENDDTMPNGVHLKPSDHFDAYIFMDRTLRGNDILPWLPTFEW